MTSAALDPGALAPLDARVSAGGRIGVAISGGSDSTALLILLLDRYGPEALASATVDHRLRPASAAEAASVGALCVRLGISHDTLAWQRAPEDTGNLQDAARRARYGLLSGWAATRGLADIALGHTRDDNAETFLLGLSRGAGLDGLTGMRRSFAHGAVTFHRPLLSARREALRQMLRARGLTWADDPSNEDPRFDRVRARRALALLAPLGIDADGLAQTIDHLADTRTAIDATLSDWARAHTCTDRGDLLIDRAALAALPRDFARRLLSAALRWIAGADYPPRAAPVLALLSAEAATTLHGCLVTPGPDTLRLSREPRAAARATPAAPGDTWDTRWRLAAPRGTVRALTEAGLAHCPDWRSTGLPRASLAASPALWDRDTLIAAPLARFGTEIPVELAKGRDDFPAALLSR